MSHDSAIQIKVSSGWVSCKSLSFYVESFNMDIFFSLLKIFQLCSTSPHMRLSFSDSMKSVALIPSPVHATVSQGLSGYSLWSLHHHTLPQDLPNSLQPVQWSPDSWLQSLRPFPFWPVPTSQAFFSSSPFTSFIFDSSQTGDLTSPWINPLLLMIVLYPWRKHFCARPLYEILPILQGTTGSCLLPEICQFTLLWSQSVFWIDTVPYYVRILNTFCFCFKLLCTCSVFLSTLDLLVFTSGGLRMFLMYSWH